MQQTNYYWEVPILPFDLLFPVSSEIEIGIDFTIKKSTFNACCRRQQLKQSNNGTKPQHSILR